jgi:cation:H+ antiporter
VPSHVVLLIGALVVLALSADRLVEHAARLAKQFGISDFIVGVTITSVGTSIPELVASVSAALGSHTGLVVGNVVGSNIANIGLILGVAAIVRAVDCEPKFYDRDGYVMLAAVILFFVMTLDNRVSALEGTGLLAAYVLYVFFLLKSDREERSPHFSDFLEYVFGFEYIRVRRRRNRSRAKEGGTAMGVEEPDRAVIPKRSLVAQAALVVIFSGAVLASATVLVREAIWLAGILAVPDSVVGVSVVAIGTSLPELSVAVSAARKGRGEMVVGNVLGSNIANILLVGGSSAMLEPLAVAELSVAYTIPILLFFSLALLYFIQSDWQIQRRQGLIAAAAYAGFLIAAVSKGWS